MNHAGFEPALPADWLTPNHRGWLISALSWSLKAYPDSPEYPVFGTARARLESLGMVPVTDYHNAGLDGD